MVLSIVNKFKSIFFSSQKEDKKKVQFYGVSPKRINVAVFFVKQTFAIEGEKMPKVCFQLENQKVYRRHYIHYVITLLLS